MRRCSALSTGFTECVVERHMRFVKAIRAEKPEEMCMAIARAKASN